jgi:predicted DsbA family dithiol-disulfide isomerase
MGTRSIEVFADIACPFTHVGLRRIAEYREAHERTEPILRVRAWPLEWVNEEPLRGSTLAPKVEALRAAVAPDLFQGFDPKVFPATMIPALDAETAARRPGLETGEKFSLRLRSALFEEGRDLSDPAVVARLVRDAGVPDVTSIDRLSVRSDFDEGRRRGVTGSPHFFTPTGGFFCPSLHIRHHEGKVAVAFDVEGFQAFVQAAFGVEDQAGAHS